MKNNVHESINQFFQPELFCETESYNIRIDQMEENNYHNYRLALWSKEKEQFDEPDVILQNGDCIFDGSGGNHYFIFNDEVQYQLYIDVLSQGFGDFSIYENINNIWWENRERTQPAFTEEIQMIEG
jgi:hypothetical protein